MAFHSVYIQRFANGKHSIAPCCLAKQSEQSTDKIDFINDRYLNMIRKEFSVGIRSGACRQCWDLEDSGGISQRNVQIAQANMPLDESVTLYNIDYNTLPLCNARCIICSPMYSSAWATSIGRVSEIIDIAKNNYDHLDGLDLSNLKRIYFNGGEPLLTDEHVELLQRVDNISNLDILYNTNGSCYPNDCALNLWNKAKSVTIFFSIDGIGHRFEETRTPLKWDQVSENIKKMNQLENINIACSYTIGRHNVYDLQDTINWFEKLPNFNIEDFYVHYVNPGHELSFDRASEYEKKGFIKELSRFNKFTKWYEGILNSLKHD